MRSAVTDTAATRLPAINPFRFAGLPTFLPMNSGAGADVAFAEDAPEVEFPETRDEQPVIEKYFQVEG